MHVHSTRVLHRPLIVVVLTLLIAIASTTSRLIADAADAADPPLSPALMARVPEAYRERAQEIRLSEDVQARYRSRDDASVFGMVVSQIAQKADGVAFLFGMIEKETVAARRVPVLTILAYSPHSARYLDEHPDATRLLARAAASEAEPKLALTILAGLRSYRQRQLGDILKARMALARANGDQKGLEELSEAESLHYKWFGNIAMPAAYHDAPPAFAVAGTDASTPIRAVAFGDFGTGETSQIQTAAAIRAYAHDHPFDFGLTLGDNFYPRGMDTPSDPRWKTQWEDLYGPLGIKFYVTLGNHDYGQPGSPLSEILYSEKSPSWVLPARYYTFTAGTAQFFMLDTINLTERELRWLDEELGKSTAAWRIVAGHYQVYSATRGDNDETQDDLVHRLRPILEKGQASVYICGHDHNLQILKPEGGVHYIVAGGGGAGLYDFTQKDYTRNTFKAKANGFAVIEADPQRLTIRLVDAEGNELDALSLKNRRGARSSREPGRLSRVEIAASSHRDTMPR